MAAYDLPSMINYALSVSGQDELFYVGHSQGTLIAFTGFSINASLAAQVKTFFALAPVYEVSHIAIVLRDMAEYLYPVVEVRKFGSLNLKGTFSHYNNIRDCSYFIN